MYSKSNYLPLRHEVFEQIDGSAECTDGGYYFGST